MPRPEKVQAVTDIKERMESARAVFLAEYAGLSVKQQQALRRGLRSQGAEFKVVKMTLARRAAAELELAEIDELLIGPTGLAFADDDPVVAAKALRDFAKDNEALRIKGGLLLGSFLTPERISELADLEPRDVLLGKIAGAMKAPLFKTANLMAALPRNAASVFKALLDKKADGAPPPQAETEEPSESESVPVAAATAGAAPPDDEAEGEPQVDAPPGPEAAQAVVAEAETEDESVSNADATNDDNDEPAGQAEEE